jgi:flagellar biosynthetic protein FliR
MSLQQFIPANLFAALLIFVRVGAALMLLPGFGESYVPQRYKLLLALLLAALLAPVLGPSLPPLPASPLTLAGYIGGEIVVGGFIGTIARIILSALETAGMVVSLQLGLSTAVVFNPMATDQAPITGALYGLLGILLIFMTDLHHMMLRAVVDSYAVFTPGKLPPVSDLSSAVAHAVANSFALAMEIAAPFLVLGIVFFVALGLIARLVPQIQILFVTQPLQILGGLLAFAFVLVAGMHWFLDAFVQQMGALFGS